MIAANCLQGHLAEERDRLSLELDAMSKQVAARVGSEAVL